MLWLFAGCVLLSCSSFLLSLYAVGVALECNDEMEKMLVRVGARAETARPDPPEIIERWDGDPFH